MTPKEVIQKVQQDLFTMQDLKYRDFHAKLMPTVDKDSVIGVRVPMLRAYAKKFLKFCHINNMKRIIFMDF